jgi:hypothetical protein
MTELALSEDALGPGLAAPWIGPLVVLGSRAWRYLARLSGRQLVIAISVPRRDFTAALIGCGWAMAHPAPQLGAPIDVLRSQPLGTPLRIVTHEKIITGRLTVFNERSDPARVHLGGMGWLVNRIRAVSVLHELDTPVRADRPAPGSAAKFTHFDIAWDARLACPPADLAIVGTRTWLLDDVNAYLSPEDKDAGEPSKISALLLPMEPQSATWSTRLYSAAGIADKLPLPAGVRGVVLDGGGAIRYLAEVEVPVVICVIDRSIADDTAAEIVVQRRNAGSDRVPMSDLGWRSVPGIEILAFTVPL